MSNNPSEAIISAFSVTIMTVMTIPLGYPLVWGHLKITVIIVMTVIFSDGATGKSQIMKLSQLR